ncbi:hypothetical protein FCU45_01205 [Sulfurimonas crateris]|uniref:UDP-3-O-(3-hydroxymyristoyl)glucosamine N-acyltransferase n=1 Tax=Sulfurimonas crateris TaxID=2574727 RepID=A0A4U2ZAJ4_9BACT|nr:hypothetical protein [Sulfurimonas crateris]TKI71035.1 hypothetical protein FCU45_01205 [Sulfurimonas crateris]
MQLSDYMPLENIHINGIFNELGYSDSTGRHVLTFCDNLNYLNIALKNDSISSIIIKKDLLEYTIDSKKGICITEEPRNTFFEIYNLLRENNLLNINRDYGVGSNVNIAPTAIVSDKSYIGNNSVISDNVIIKDNVFIGNGCFIDAGAILGNDGVLYMEKEKNNIFIRHAGVVTIGNNVTILSNAVVVKSVFPNMPTKIGDYSIIGISTTIGHEAVVGKNCRVLGNCVVAKNAQVGDGSIIGTSSVIRENITLGKNVDVKAGSVVIKDVKDGGVVSGNFAMNHSLNVKNYFKGQK